MLARIRNVARHGAQIRQEIQLACSSIPLMSLPTIALFMLEVRGYSKLYSDWSERGVAYLALSFLLFLVFTDMCIYWIHRWLHHPLLYGWLHKPHHRWIVPTPFASHAFHPVDGFLQSMPYHIFVFLLPMHRSLYLGAFLFVNIWTVSIHDAISSVPAVLRPFINGAAHHTDHHLYFKYNYGQFFTLWDRIGLSFREPSTFHGDGPMDQVCTDDALEKAGKAPPVHGLADNDAAEALMANAAPNGHAKST